jgi:hypothetical protein
LRPRSRARGHRSDLLPVSRSEYLALDIVAFEIAGDRRWRFPVLNQWNNGSSPCAPTNEINELQTIRAN